MIPIYSTPLSLVGAEQQEIDRSDKLVCTESEHSIHTVLPSSVTKP